MKNYGFVYQQHLGPDTFYPTYDANSNSIVIGAGYNLSNHSQSDIISDLTQAGFDPKTAQVFAEASSKTGEDAKNWAEQHKYLILSENEHQGLFNKIIVPEYEENLHHQLSNLKSSHPSDFEEHLQAENLSDNQKQILFDFVRKDNLENHPKLTSTVVNENWNGTVNEFEKFDTDSSFSRSIEKIFNEFFSKDETIAPQLEPQNQAVEWVQTSPATENSNEQILDLSIPTNYEFTYNQEIGHQGQSLVPHFPGGKSGVTIGPGYDMGHRTPEEIYKDLSAAGIDPDTIQILVASAHKIGPDAQEWVSAHHNVHITDEQQRYLFYNVLVPEYEERVQTQIASFLEEHPNIDPNLGDWDNLSDKQRQMLFDFAYNPGLDRFPTVTNAILNEDWETVYQSFERFSAGEPLAYRNEKFYDEFLNDTLHHDYHSVVMENAVDENPYDDYYTL